MDNDDAFAKALGLQQPVHSTGTDRDLALRVQKAQDDALAHRVDKLRPTRPPVPSDCDLALRFQKLMGQPVAPEPRQQPLWSPLRKTEAEEADELMEQVRASLALDEHERASSAVAPTLRGVGPQTDADAVEDLLCRVKASVDRNSLPHGTPTLCAKDYLQRRLTKLQSSVEHKSTGLLAPEAAINQHVVGGPVTVAGACAVDSVWQCISEGMGDASLDLDPSLDLDAEVQSAISQTLDAIAAEHCPACPMPGTTAPAKAPRRAGSQSRHKTPSSQIDAVIAQVLCSPDADSDKESWASQSLSTSDSNSSSGGSGSSDDDHELAARRGKRAHNRAWRRRTG